jgi:hypothetical protein
MVNTALVFTMNKFILVTEEIINVDRGTSASFFQFCRVDENSDCIELRQAGRLTGY